MTSKSLHTKQPDLMHAVQEPANAAASPEEEHYLPPRKTVHPTEKEKWVRVFYRSLLWIFVLLVVGLLFWGWQYINAK